MRRAIALLMLFAGAALMLDAPASRGSNSISIVNAIGLA